MNISAGSLLKLDRAFWLPYHLFRWIQFLAPIRETESDRVVVIKLMGLGSITRFADLCRTHHVDINKIKLVTFAHQAQLCSLLGFDVALIRTDNILHFISDCSRTLKEAHSFSPFKIIDFERCSYSVSLFRLLLAWRCKCPQLSFDTEKMVTSKKETIIPISNMSMQDIFETGIRHIPKSSDYPSQTQVSIDETKIIININTSDYLLARRYPRGRYLQLINQLHQWNSRFKFYLTGSSFEANYVDHLIKDLNVMAVNVAGKWSLAELLEELSTCALFITADSGPLHLAAFLNIPTIAIWGPTQPLHFGYIGRNNLHSVSLGLSCSPCFKHPRSKPAQLCEGKIDCISNLAPQLIFEKAAEVLSLQPSQRLVEFPKKFRPKENILYELTAT